MAIDSLLSAGEDHYSRRVACFPDPVVFLRRLKISSAVHDEIILEEILFNLLISSVICIFRVEVDDSFSEKMVRMV